MKNAYYETLVKFIHFARGKLELWVYSVQSYARKLIVVYFTLFFASSSS
jgi:hypothetical protein